MGGEKIYLIDCIVDVQNTFKTEWIYANKSGWEIWLRAKACYQNNFITAEALKDILLDRIVSGNLHDDRAAINEFILNLNGCFVVIIKSRSFFFAAVDHLRSIPLFYGRVADNFFVSDDAGRILSHYGVAAPNLRSSIEFILSGYVSGSDTLFSEIKQLQAGEILFFSPLNDDDISCHIIEKNISQVSPVGKRSDCTEQLESTLMRVFSRLVDSVQGRPIVVPLSDGYDSRLIVTMLSRLKVKNVICFTYAKSGARILKAAEHIARKASYPWLFVPYTKQRWQMCLNDDKTREFIKKAHNLHTLPNFQDFPAVKHLCEQGLISPDAIFVPGHTPMMYLKDQPDEASRSGVVNSILQKHYTRWDWSFKKKTLMPFLQDKIIETLPNGPSFNSLEDAVLAFEAWELRERQAKFIVNAVRTYEFFGYEWRLPLWDKELVRFWLSLPLSVREGKLPIKNLLENKNIEKSFPAKKCSQKREYLRNIKSFLAAHPVLFYIVNKFDIRPSQLLSYWTNPLAFYGVTSFWEFITSYHYNINAHSFLIRKLYAEEYNREFAQALTSYFTRSIPPLEGKSPMRGNE